MRKLEILLVFMIGVVVFQADVLKKSSGKPSWICVPQNKIIPNKKSEDLEYITQHPIVKDL